MNDEERRMWIENDEPLYNWRRSERKSISEFIKENREAIDAYINKRLGRVA